MAPVSNQPVTAAEFMTLPEDTGAVYQELRGGEVVEMVRPKFGHVELQHRLARLLERALTEHGEVRIELPFRALPEHEYRVADVAYMTRERWAATDRSGDFIGAPDLVVEVLSPSNTALELFDRQDLCLGNGSREFWIVDPERRRVRVAAAGRSTDYREGEAIPLAALGATGLVPVAAIFD